MRERHPEEFATLASHEVDFFDLTPHWHLRAQHPIFQLHRSRRAGSCGSDGGRGGHELHRIHFNEQTRDSWRQWHDGPRGRALYSRAVRCQQHESDELRSPL